LGNCRYCGKPVGFLKNKHAECEKTHTNGLKKIRNVVTSLLSDDSKIREQKTALQSIASNCYINNQDLNNAIHNAWEAAVDEAFEDGVLSENEEKRLLEMIKEFGFDQDALYSDPTYAKIVKGSVLREILEGKIPERIKTSSDLPFNFQKNEKLVWVFQDVKYYEMRTKREFRGGHHGVSMRVAKGFYYRVGSFRGFPVETTQTIHADTGILAITDKHLYFGGSEKIFRIKYDKILSFEPYSNGIGIQRDTMTAKPQIFETGDGWFTHNLVTNLAKI